MKEIQYVRIRSNQTGCWYNRFEYEGAIFQVTEKTNGTYLTTESHLTIHKSDCEPVKIKELDKDVDENYLECGERVIDPVNPDKEIYFVGMDRTKQFYICEHQEARDSATTIYIRSIFKIPKEEKKGKTPEQMAEDIKKWREQATPEEMFQLAVKAGIYTPDGELTETYGGKKIDPIEDVSDEPPQSGYFEEDEEKNVDPIEEAITHLVCYRDDCDLDEESRVSIHHTIESLKQHMEDKK